MEFLDSVDIVVIAFGSVAISFMVCITIIVVSAMYFWRKCD